MSDASNNSSSPDGRIGFYPGGLDRSTFNVVWTCFGALFFSTWTTVHLNMPSKTENAIWPLLRKLKWMAITIIAPEATTCMALNQLLQAHALTRRMRTYGLLDWTHVHSHILLMGGYEVIYDVGGGETTPGSVMLSAEVAEEIASKYPGLWDNGQGPMHLFEIQGMVNGHDDPLARGLAILQISWLFIHFIFRTKAGLPNSELEVSTLAVVWAAYVNYILWWEKPGGLVEPIRISWPVRPSPEHRRLLGISDDPGSHHVSRQARMQNLIAPHAVFANMGGRGQLASNADDKKILDRIIVALSVGSIVFCGLHIAAWNFSFATDYEKWMWRGASLVSLLASLGVVFCLWISANWKNEKERHKGTRTSTAMLIIFLALYAVSRAVVIFEVFYAFRSMPMDFYVIEGWTRYFPRF